MALTEYIEHTFLKPDTTIGDIDRICREAAEYSLKAICIPPLFVKSARCLIGETALKITTVAGFPFGYSAIEAKIAEIVLAIIDGVDEIEVVINTSAVKNADWQFLANEINNIMPVARGRGKKITVILETALMTDQEIITACDIYGAAGVDFIKAGTGTISQLNLVEQVRLIRKHLAERIGIKVATDVNNFNQAKDLFNAGANCLSCSNTLMLLQEELQQH